MGVPDYYRKSPAYSASFDFIDTISLLGYNTYYGTYDGSTYKFNRKQIASNKPTKNYTESSAGGALQALATLDFDLDFNKATLVGGGPLLVEVTLDTTGQVSNHGHTTELDLEIFKVVGGTPTSLGTATGTSQDWAANIGQSHRHSTIFSMPLTLFKAGETLRVELKLKAITANGTSTIYRVWMDGSGRGASKNKQIDTGDTSTTYDYYNPTDLRLTLPFKIDL